MAMLMIKGQIREGEKVNVSVKDKKLYIEPNHTEDETLSKEST